jgi:hypothetical protein
MLDRRLANATWVLLCKSNIWKKLQNVKNEHPHTLANWRVGHSLLISKEIKESMCTWQACHGLLFSKKSRGGVREEMGMMWLWILLVKLGNRSTLIIDFHFHGSYWQSTSLVELLISLKVYQILLFCWKTHILSSTKSWPLREYTDIAKLKPNVHNGDLMCHSCTFKSKIQVDSATPKSHALLWDWTMYMLKNIDTIMGSMVNTFRPMWRVTLIKEQKRILTLTSYNFYMILYLDSKL